MSATNTTTYYEFPVFVGSDKPAWLVDWNGAMNAIDSAIHEAKTEADANATNIASLQSSVTSLSGSVESQGSSITSLTQSLTALQGTVNTITSLIGNGLPTTDDKTIIGAINELKAEIDALDPSGEGVQAKNVSYDNTDSGLTAINVQDAIDEVNGKISTPDAKDVSYDNTTSGLTATNVQSAIDELAQGGSIGAWSKINTTDVTSAGDMTVSDISDYSELLLVTQTSQAIITHLMPVSLFKLGKTTGLYLPANAGATFDNCYTSFAYTNDTTVAIRFGGTGYTASIYAR